MDISQKCLHEDIEMSYWNSIMHSQFFRLIITGRNEVVAKVMFLQVCVCPQGGGCLPQCMLGYHPPDQADPPGPGRPPRTRQNPLDQGDPTGPGRPPQDQADPPPPGPGRPPGTRQTPPGSRLQHTVYERPVRILLECILVD